LFCQFLLIIYYLSQFCLLPFLSIHLPVSSPFLKSLPATCNVCSPNHINYPRLTAPRFITIESNTVT
jgi:hypothetical protein